MDWPSPPALSKLGVCENRVVLAVVAVLKRDCRRDRTLPLVAILPLSADLFLGDTIGLTGLGVVEGLGGCGKAAMLMVFRIVRSGIGPLLLPSDEAERRVGTTGYETAC